MRQAMNRCFYTQSLRYISSLFEYAHTAIRTTNLKKHALASAAWASIIAYSHALAKIIVARTEINRVTRGKRVARFSTSATILLRYYYFTVFSG